MLARVGSPRLLGIASPPSLRAFPPSESPSGSCCFVLCALAEFHLNKPYTMKCCLSNNSNVFDTTVQLEQSRAGESMVMGGNNFFRNKADNIFFSAECFWM